MFALLKKVLWYKIWWFCWEISALRYFRFMNINFIDIFLLLSYDNWSIVRLSTSPTMIQPIAQLRQPYILSLTSSVSLPTSRYDHLLLPSWGSHTSSAWPPVSAYQHPGMTTFYCSAEAAIHHLPDLQCQPTNIQAWSLFVILVPSVVEPEPDFLAGARAGEKAPAPGCCSLA